jgi:hypothetical protein
MLFALIVSQSYSTIRRSWRWAWRTLRAQCSAGEAATEGSTSAAALGPSKLPFCFIFHTPGVLRILHLIGVASNLGAKLPAATAAHVVRDPGNCL